MKSEYTGSCPGCKRFQPEVYFAHALLRQWFVEEKRVEDAACFLICVNKEAPSSVGTSGVDLISSLELIDHWAGGGPVATCCNCVANPATFQKKQEWYTFDDEPFLLFQFCYVFTNYKHVQQNEVQQFVTHF